MAAAAKENLLVFHQSIKSIFDRWTGLQLAVTKGCGGPHSQEKALWMVDAVYNWFQENDDIEPFELEDFLADILDAEFDTIAEDGSLNSIATNICSNFQLCITGHHQNVLNKIKELPKVMLGECVADDREHMEEENESMQDSNMQALLGGMELSQQSQQGMSSQQINQQGPSSSSTSSSTPSTSSSTSSTPSQSGTEGAGSSFSSNSNGAVPEEDDGWTVVQKSKKK